MCVLLLCTEYSPERFKPYRGQSMLKEMYLSYAYYKRSVLGWYSGIVPEILYVTRNKVGLVTDRIHGSIDPLFIYIK